MVKETLGVLNKGFNVINAIKKELKRQYDANEIDLEEYTSLIKKLEEEGLK